MQDIPPQDPSFSIPHAAGSPTRLSRVHANNNTSWEEESRRGEKKKKKNNGEHNFISCHWTELKSRPSPIVITLKTSANNMFSNLYVKKKKKETALTLPGLPVAVFELSIKMPIYYTGNVTRRSEQIDWYLALYQLLFVEGPFFPSFSSGQYKKEIKKLKK